eukprot:9298433-Ditylum_brightwellii.AAC.1
MEKLDKEIGNILQDAENKIKLHSKYWRPDKLHMAHKLVEYWRAAVSYQRNNMAEDCKLQERAVQAGLDIDILGK